MRNVSVVLSEEMRGALEALAFRGDETLSALIRRVLASHLRDAGVLAPKAPPTRQIGLANPNYIGRGGDR